jgi:hypothetical protein
MRLCVYARQAVRERAVERSCLSIRARRLCNAGGYCAVQDARTGAETPCLAASSAHETQPFVKTGSGPTVKQALKMAVSHRGSRRSLCSAPSGRCLRLEWPTTSSTNAIQCALTPFSHEKTALYGKLQFVCQDRLGTNIRKAQANGAFFVELYGLLAIVYGHQL